VRAYSFVGGVAACGAIGRDGVGGEDLLEFGGGLGVSELDFFFGGGVDFGEDEVL
jgi:hypothetical protein